MKPLWIVGTSGAALEVWAVHAALEQGGEAPTLEGFISIEGAPHFDPRGLALVLEERFLREMDPALSQVVLAIGAPRARARAAMAYQARGFGFCTLIHPSATIGPRVRIGAGSVVMAGAVLETDVTIGEHSLINVQASLAHECQLGAACSLGPGVHLAGRVQVGDQCDLGVGAVVRPNITLGSNVVLGAGAAVVKDFTGPGTLVGVPARPR